MTARHVSGTVPYAWPWDGRLDVQRCALVIAGNSMNFTAADAADPMVIRMRMCVDLALTQGFPVLALRHVRPLGVVAASVTSPVTVDDTVDCFGVDGFCGGPLDQLLREQRRDQLLLVGFGLETAVHSTMRSANDRGYECLLIEDACVSGPDATEAVRSGAVSSVCMSGGIFGAVGSTEAVLAAFARPNPTDERHSP